MSEEEKGSAKADKAIASAEITIAGELHHLKYTLWSFCKLDELTGKNPLISTSWADIHPKDILGLLWAGLLHENRPGTGKPWTIEELGSAISVSDIPLIAPMIQRAMGQAIPEASAEKKTPSEIAPA